MNARTRYRYQRPDLRFGFWKLVALAPTRAICKKPVQLDPLHRSIRKPSSFGELSLHARVMTPDLGPAVAVRFVGAAGGPGAGGVVASATFENADVPPLLYARTS